MESGIILMSTRCVMEGENNPKSEQKLQHDEVERQNLAIIASDMNKSVRKERCLQWVSDQNHLPPPTPLNIDSQLEDSKANYKNMIKQLRFKKLSEIKCKMICEWNRCLYVTTNYIDFGKHVKNHSQNIDTNAHTDKKEFYTCEWKECGFETQNEKEIKRHIQFHSYHTKLKALGVDVHTRYSLNECNKDSSNQNKLPELPTDFNCRWVECSMIFNDIQDYFDHVKCHVIGVDSTQNGWLHCGWLGCNQKFTALNSLKLHIRKHTGEKVVACFKCGGIFATNSVYEDHCLRQAQSMDDLRCETCRKTFSSERILRNHARRHINSYKCSYCDLSLSAPSALTKHIRYKHLDYRPFQCQHCSYKAVNKDDLESHLLCHEGVPSSKKRKLKKADSECSSKIYACHICEKFYKSGRNLTKHLFGYHGYDQTSTSSRLRYEQSEDGFYRLIPVRYESLEVSRQIIEEQGHSNMYQNKNSDEEVDEFNLLQCFEGNDMKPPSFVVLPSSLNEPDVLKNLLMASENAAFSDSDNLNNVNVKNSKVKSQRKHGGRITKSKKAREETSNAVKSVNVEKSHNTKKKENSEAKSHVGNNEQFKSIEISIAHLDEKGNIIKKELIKSQEMYTMNK